MKTYNFKTTLKRPKGIRTWHYVDTPIQVEKEFNTKDKVAICGIMNGTRFKATLIPRGNREHYIVLGKENRLNAKIEVGDNIEMEVWKDNTIKKVEIPNDFQLSLLKNKMASTFFNDLAYSYKKAYIDWINNAKKEATRANRITKSIVMLVENIKLR